LRQDLALVTLELIEISQYEFIVSLGFLLVFGYLGVAFEAFFILSSKFVQFVLEVIQLSFQVSLFFFPSIFMFLFAFMDFLQLILKVVIGLQLVS